ncbi:unnamed protein product [Moneuplotes crassus]|uniref:Uncharacterized protein n=1 Tax=Euplotes crassus TaxID=5936 RepID=A0AAD1X8C3_EUPCR|nr:unnamed protein product [Moneuplotes crassus]
MDTTHEEEKDVSTLSLREYVKHRLMDDMLAKVKRVERANNYYLILVMDKHTRKLFADVCSLFEIMTKNVFQLENLELQRKKFPSTAAIYFISPTESSIKKLLEDYEDPKEPQYASAHVFLSTKLSDSLMDELSRSQGLISSIKTLTELNVDINLYENNIFHLDQSDSLNLQIRDPDLEGTAQYLDQIGLQLFTVCSVMNQRPYIRYQGDSHLSKKVAKAVNAKFTFKTQTFQKQKGTLLILDRSFDLTSPLLHDYSYECLVYENVTSPEGADRIGTEEQKCSKSGRTEKILSEQDHVWSQYKSEHFASAMISINEEVDAFIHENKNIGDLKRGNQLEVTDLKDVISAMPKYQELLSIYSKHLNLCQFVDKNLKARKLIDLIRVEQLIISGLTDKGSEVSNRQIIKEINKIYKELHPEDHLRLILLYLVCYEISGKDAKSLFSTLDHYGQETCENLKEIFGPSHSGLIRRRVPVMDSDEFRDYQDKLANTDYEILKSTPTITSLAKLASEDSLDVEDFPYIGPQPSNGKPGKSKKEARLKFKDRNRWRNKRKKKLSSCENKLIIFIIGGISHHELVALNKLQSDHEVDCTIIPGGNMVFSPKEFIKQLHDLSDDDHVKHAYLEIEENSVVGIDQVEVDMTEIQFK